MIRISSLLAAAVLIAAPAHVYSQQQDTETRQAERRRALFGREIDPPAQQAYPPYGPWSGYNATPCPPGVQPWAPGAAHPVWWAGSNCIPVQGYGMQGYGHYGYPPGYGRHVPPPMVLPPEERPHRFYARFHPDAGTGVPPLTCDPRSAAGCPPGQVNAQPAIPACADVHVRTVTDVVYQGRVWLPAYGALRIDELSLALERALARGEAVSIVGRHGYPLFLPPAAWIHTIQVRPCS